MTVFAFFKSFREAPPKKQLKLPRRFLRLHGETLSNLVFLKLRCGSEWEIGLKKSNGKVWLKQGWPEFATRYSLEKRRLIFFRYKGNSHFTVSIFGKTACQIYYTPTPGRSDEPGIDGDPEVPVDKGTEFDNPVQISNSLSLFSIPKEESPSSSSPTLKRKRANTSGLWKGSRAENSTSNEASVASNSEIEGNFHHPAEEESRNTPATQIRMTELKVHRRTQSKIPFFIVSLGASYASARSHFHIPNKFARRYIDKVEGEATLKVSDGRSWSVQYKVREFMNRAPVAEFCFGWNAFARDNCLEEGDICTFELIERNDITFKVSICKSNDHLSQGKLRRQLGFDKNAGCHITRRPSSLNINRAFGAASKFFSTNPYFQADLPLHHVDESRVSPPFGFVKSYLEEKSQTVTLQVGEKSWPVKLLVFPSIFKSKFSGGWPAFMRENSLRPRDVLIFELIKRNPVVFEVSVFCEIH